MDADEEEEEEEGEQFLSFEILSNVKGLSVLTDKILLLFFSRTSAWEERINYL